MTSASKRPKKPASPATENQPVAQGQSARNVRETIESIVVAFVLAFLFRTFEAEAFVIPTGSMAPTLMGRHKDVYCEKCGHRYQASASHEEDEAVQRMRGALQQARNPNERTALQGKIAGLTTFAGTCPMCRWTQSFAEFEGGRLETDEPSYSGDRIIVSKLAYTFSDPERWDVVVFRYPGEAQQNYIKRMVGLPGETIRIHGGDLFVKQAAAADDGGTEGDGFSIARKPPFKVLAMMQAVHDTAHFPVALEEAGWPFRWGAVAAAKDAKHSAWKSEFRIEELRGRKNAVQQFSTDGSGRETAWIRYHHVVPDYDDWVAIEEAREGGAPAVMINPVPQLITDYYAYNTDMQLNLVAHQNSLQPPNSKLGLHWVGDLILECDVTVEAATGEVLLDLVEGGKHFRCTIDLKSGRADLGIAGADGFSATGQTPLDEPGTYRLRFANVDDRLLLWVDDDLVDLGGPEGGAEYSVSEVYGGREKIVPQASSQDPGDLAPAGVGSRGAALSVTNLRVSRDIYYIADRHDAGQGQDITDLKQQVYVNLAGGGGQGGRETYREYLTDPQLWPELVDRRSFEFDLAKNQFFVLGDNSPSSKDSRLWLKGEDRQLGRGGPVVEVKRPGGHYVERRLLTGKALFVYWPHSWGRIPGTGIPLPFFPNVGDMRLVK